MTNFTRIETKGNAASENRGVQAGGSAAHHRIHALDLLRAVMMLAGVLFHTVISYRVTPSALWTFKDEATTYLADFIVLLIYMSRMPIFFVLAGFFAALLYFRRGAELISPR